MGIIGFDNFRLGCLWRFSWLHTCDGRCSRLFLYPFAPRSKSDITRSGPSIIIICLALAWIIGFYQNGVFSFSRFGTRFYGRKETEQGYITTKWLVAGFPIIPIRSYIVVYQGEDIWKYETQYQQNIMYPIAGYYHWGQMLRTAAVSYGTIVWCLGCVWLMFLDPCI